MTTMEVYWKESYNIILIMGRWAWGRSSSTAALCESSRAIRVGKRKKKSPYILPKTNKDLDDAFLLLKTFFGQAMDKKWVGLRVILYVCSWNQRYVGWELGFYYFSSSLDASTMFEYGPKSLISWHCQRLFFRLSIDYFLPFFMHWSQCWAPK